MDTVAKRSFRALILAVFSLFLCSFTLVLGAIPLHAWRQTFGKGHFVVGAGLMVVASSALGLFPLAVAIASLSLLVFLFNEFDERGLDIVRSGGYALIGTLGAGYVGAKAWMTSSGLAWQDVVTAPVESFLQQLKRMNGGSTTIQIAVEDIVAQVPSGVFIVLAASLVMALLFEPRTRSMLGLEEKNRRAEFLKFRMPDVFIWLAIASLLAAFLKTEMTTLQHVGLNIVNSLVFLYFLQGMAIVTEFFNYYRVGPLMRSISYIFLVLQLFVFVSCLGFIDFWFDFRARMSDQTEDGAKKFNDKGGIS